LEVINKISADFVITETQIKQKIMFGIFKREQVERVQKETTVSIDQQIYDDVYSAQELLLKEANEILTKASDYDEEKHSRMKQMSRLGFSNAQQIKEFNDLEQKRRKQEAIKEKITYYKQEYPFNKFISKDCVKTICEKYKLLLTEVRDYVAEIPEKNQKERCERTYRSYGPFSLDRRYGSLYS